MHHHFKLDYIDYLYHYYPPPPPLLLLLLILTAFISIAPYLIDTAFYKMKKRH